MVGASQELTALVSGVDMAFTLYIDGVLAGIWAWCGGRKNNRWRQSILYPDIRIGFAWILDPGSCS